MKKLIFLALVFVFLEGCASSGLTMKEVYAKADSGALKCEKCSVREIESKIVFPLFKAFQYTKDEVQYNLEDQAYAGMFNTDYWSMLPDSGKGDCEDFAITLRYLLNKSGIKGTRLLRTYSPKGNGHMFLEVNGWVFDNSSPVASRVEYIADMGYVLREVGDENGIWKKVEGIKK